MPLPTPDWYAILGVSPSATRDEIGAAFRSAMKTCHPDLFPGDPEKGARARALSGAKSILGDEKRRAAYDATRARAASKPGPRPESNPHPGPGPEPGPGSESKTRSKPKPEPARPRGASTKAARPARKSPWPAKPTSRSRRAVEYLGLRRYAGRSWKQTVARMHRQAIQALNPGKKLPTMRIVECTVKEPGVVELRFAYSRSRRRVVMAPNVARLYWAA